MVVIFINIAGNIFCMYLSREVFPSASVNKDDFSHCENVVSHMIEPSFGRNLKSKVFSSWATCYLRQCVDNTVAGNDLRLENRHLHFISPSQFVRNIE